RWLVGPWSEADLVLVAAGPRRFAVFGRTDVDADRLAALLARSPDDIDALARTVPGCVHQVASMAGRVLARGSLSTARHIFFSVVHGMTVAASTPVLLARLIDARVDETALAVRLLAPGAALPRTQTLP